MRGGVFLCHASRDAGMAQRAVTALEAAGVPCWIAPRDIDAGENYTQAILDGLEAAPAVVLVFSSATNESPHVIRELETAVGSGRRIIPVRLEEVEPSPSLRYFIGTAQWLEASGAVDDWSPALVRAVRRATDRHDTQPTPTPTPPPTPAPAAAPVAPVAAGSGWNSRRTAFVGTGLVVAVVLAVVVTISLTGGDPGSPAAGQTGADQSPAASSTSTQVPTQGSTQGTPTGNTQQKSPSDGPVDATSSAAPVTCWDGSTARGATQCPVPTGRAGMATVFPGLGSSCTTVDSPIEGKAEVYECQHNGFIVRYTRWDPGFDKERYYDVENQVASQPWEISGEAAGLQWFSVENDPSEEQPYQWSAAYAGLPFSLSVEGETQADRSAGLTELELVPPSRVGLAP